MLLYLHGFNSSPGSHKATLMANYMAKHYPDEKLVIPQLGTEPLLVQRQILDHAQVALGNNEPLRLVGSSLGGFLATYLVETIGEQFGRDQIKAVLVNPAVRPYELLCDYIGEQTNPYTGRVYHVEAEHMDQLRQMDFATLSLPDAYMVMVQSDDEVLDFRQAVSKYQCCRQVIESGGDHSFVGFENHLPDITRFLGLT